MSLRAAITKGCRQRCVFLAHDDTRLADAERVLAEGEQPENLVLRFDPAGGVPILVVCLWSRWVGANGEELLSFAAITDERPPEVSAAGNDRCIVPIPAKSIDAWLCPDSGDLASLYAILDDRERPYYEHKLAA